MAREGHQGVGGVGGGGGGGCCMGGVLDVICAARTSSGIVIGIDGWLSLAAQRSALARLGGWPLAVIFN